MIPVLVLLLFQDPYEALRAKDWDRAIVLLRQAGLRKDLAYALLKTGDTEAARDEFEQVMRQDPGDRQAALEYAFLCYETKRRAEARRVFDRLRKLGDATAEQAFQNIDRPLAEGIARWRAVVAQSPDNLSARRELARLAEERDDLPLAAENYLAAWRLRPDDRELLLDLGRVWQALGKAEDAQAALLAARWGSSAHVAERARELLPGRYPFVYEFRRALERDGSNIGLRRELGFLLLAMGSEDEAVGEFRRVLETAPRDRLAAAQLGFLLLARGDRAAALPLLEAVVDAAEDELTARVRATLKLPPELRRRAAAEAARLLPKDAGERAYKTGMLREALRQFTAAHASDPLDFAVMLKLGWTLNLLQQDARAMSWFKLASKSPDPAVAEEAGRAYRNLRPSFARVRTTFWVFPFWSSRWHDLFSYAQVKTEFSSRRLPVRPYVSVRFLGDTRRVAGAAAPEFLSETAFVFAAGLASRTWRGLTLWGEAGEAVAYVRRPGRAVPDYRGGAAFARGFGTPLGAEGRGWFVDTNADGVFLSRFGNDFIGYGQNRFGYTLGPAQVYLGANLAADAKREYWANVAEFGPGLRFRVPPVPAAFSVNLLRGVYTRNEGNPRGPNFVDVRIGVWYAVTR